MLDLAVQRLSLRRYSRARVMRPYGELTRSPRVSVIVPCYNYGRFLDACVASILVQPGVDVDVLIIDDASPDGSGDVADSIAAREPRVQVLHNATNRGHIATYNTGFSQVQGEYVLLLSADDVLAPGALPHAVRLMECHPSVGFVYGGWAVDFSDEPPALPRTHARSWTIWRGEDWLAFNCRRATNVIRSSDGVIRRSVLERVGGYREDLPHSGDHEFWMRAAGVTDVGMVSGVDLVYYRLHGTNMSRTVYADAVVNLDETRKAFDAALDGSVGGDRTQLAELRRTAYRVLARRALRFALRDHLTRPDGAASTAAYREFALSLDPGVARSRIWRALQRREALGRDRAPAAAVLHVLELRRELKRRYRRRFSAV
jgi:glycosyltransferase involved in cell wall biosynthesis